MHVHASVIMEAQTSQGPKMVRAWHWDIIPILDDDRLVANHAEAHYMLNALERGEGMWWKHPETQRLYHRETLLEDLHDLTVREMEARGYNHKTPITNPSDRYMSVLSLRESREWRNQDMADLFRKWEAEGRWDAAGGFHSGKIKKRNGIILGFHEPRSAINPPRQTMKELSHRYLHREWTKADRERLKKVMSER